MSTKQWLSTPAGAMWVAFSVYAVKFAAKLSLGMLLVFAAVTADGWHNLSDIATVIGVLWVLRHIAKFDKKVRFGEWNYESIFSLAQGLALLFVGLHLCWDSLVGIWTMATQDVAPLSAAIPHGYHWVAVLYAVSALLSFALSHYQIVVGRNHNRPMVVNDGKETRSDAWVELGVLVGVIGMIMFNSPLTGYFAGIVVTVKLAITCRELITESRDALLQRSIGFEHDGAIRQLFLNTPGVYYVPECRTYRAGGIVRVELKVVVSEKVIMVAANDLKWAVGSRIVQYLTSEGMPDSLLNIRFDSGPAYDRRVAYTIVRDGKLGRIVSFTEATHVRYCDIAHGRIVHIEDVPLDEGGDVLETFWRLVAEKHIVHLTGASLSFEELQAGRQLTCTYGTMVVPYAPQVTD